MMHYLLSVDLIPSDLSLESLTDCRVKWLLDIVELEWDGENYSVECFKTWDRVIANIIKYNGSSSKTFTISFQNSLRLHRKGRETNSHKPPHRNHSLNNKRNHLRNNGSLIRINKNYSTPFLIFSPIFFFYVWTFSIMHSLHHYHPLLFLCLFLLLLLWLVVREGWHY